MLLFIVSGRRGIVGFFLIILELSVVPKDIENYVTAKACN